MLTAPVREESEEDPTQQPHRPALFHCRRRNGSHFGGTALMDEPVHIEQDAGPICAPRRTRQKLVSKVWNCRCVWRDSTRETASGLGAILAVNSIRPCRMTGAWLWFALRVGVHGHVWSSQVIIGAGEATVIFSIMMTYRCAKSRQWLALLSHGPQRG